MRVNKDCTYSSHDSGYLYKTTVNPNKKKEYQKHLLELCRKVKKHKKVLQEIMFFEKGFVPFFENIFKKIENGSMTKKQLLVRGKWSKNVIEKNYKIIFNIINKIKKGDKDIKINLYNDTNISDFILDDCLMYIYSNGPTKIFESNFNDYIETKNFTANEVIPYVIGRATSFVKFNNYAVEFDDLIQEGMIGVLRGIEKFDTEKNVGLLTYLDFWIKEKIRKEISSKDGLIRLPQNIKDIRRLATLSGISNKTNMENKDYEYIKNKTKSSKNLIKDAMTFKNCFSLEEFTDLLDRDEVGELNFLKDKTIFSQPDVFVEKELMREDIDKILKTLPEKDAFIISARFGFDGNGGKTLKEIGDCLQISRERVRQIQDRAIKNIKVLLKKIGDKYEKI